MSGEVIVALVGAGALVLAGLITLLGTKGKTQADAKTALDERIDERVSAELSRVYARLDVVETTSTRKMSAVARVLRSIANQWPDPHGPNLDPADIDEIEDTIPPTWLRRRRPTTGGTP